MDNDEQIASQLSGTLSQLRTEIDNAFSDAPVRDDSCNMDSSSSKGEPLEEQKLRQALKLTQYLLHIKEKQVTDYEWEKSQMDISLKLLADTLYASITGELSLDWMMNTFTQIMGADGGLLWVQKGHDYSVSSALMAVDEAEELFRSLLGPLSEGDIKEPYFSFSGKHYLAFTRSEDTGNRFAPFVIVLLLMREASSSAQSGQSSRKPFNRRDSDLALRLFQSLFVHAVRTGGL